MNLALMTQRPRLGHTVVRANMAGAGAALTIAGVLLIVFQFIALRAALVRDVHVQARIIGLLQDLGQRLGLHFCLSRMT